MKAGSHFNQDIFTKPHPPIRITTLSESEFTSESVTNFLATARNPAIIGVAPAFGPRGMLKAVALASSTDVLVLKVGNMMAQRSSRRRLADEIFTNPALFKVVFRSEILASALYLDLHLRVAKTIDLFSLSASDACPTVPELLDELFGESSFHLYSTRRLFSDEKYNSENLTHLAMRAWVAQETAFSYGLKRLETHSKLDSRFYTTQSLATLSVLVRHACRLDALKPHTTKNDIKGSFVMKKGKLHVQSTRFKTRLQPSRSVRVTTVDNDKHTDFHGHISKARGRAATITMKHDFKEKKITITTIGKDPLTCAEKERQHIVWLAFHLKTPLEHLPFFSKIWPYAKSPSSSHTLPALPSSPLLKLSRSLNSSQATAVKAILSNTIKTRLMMIHGPPGSGKTTVIATSVNSMSKASPDRSIWLIAQSNVAVKNIAEKLASIDFLKFRLLVSEGFHFDWHEHLYEKIVNNVIRSDEFPKDPIAMGRKLLDARVILCTLSMLSSPAIPMFARIAPVETVIVDEASQIEKGGYIPLLHAFKGTLAKLVFIGDDKQLAPFGKEDISDLQSIFETNLRSDAVFLDTSYRMPTVIGNFISTQIYGGRLRTVHNLHTMDACRFVDVDKGKEEKSGHSWINQEEIHMAIRIARRFQAEGKSFRIITGYDAQRSALEQAMKDEQLPWEDKCFNVDSFQGNEDDYIIVSVVRTKNLGFLSNLRRSNVMLTRCKRGMVICSSRGFLSGPGYSSLIGELARECGNGTWLTRQQIMNGKWSMPS